LEWLKLQTSNFVHGLATKSANLQMTNCFLIGRVRATWRILEFHTHWNISGTAEARVVQFCVRARYVKIVSLRIADHLSNWRGPVTWSILECYAP